MKKTALFSIILLFMCSTAFGKIHVVTTTFILSSIVKQIGGQFTDVAYIVPSASNPHIFTPKPKSLTKLSKANLYIGIGYGFEFWISGVKDILKDKKVLFLSDYYTNPLDRVMIGKNIIANPHIWLDMRFMGKVAVYKIADELCDIDSNHCVYFKKNADNLSKKIEIIRSYYVKIFKNFRGYCFLDIKPAFEYMIRSVGEKSCCVLIKKGNEEPSIGDIETALKRCRCKKGFVLYIADVQLAKMISEKLGYAMVNLNPLGDPKHLNSYCKLLMYNLELFKKAAE